MALGDDLEALVDAGGEGQYVGKPVKHPAGWEPGVAWDGHGGTLTTAPLEAAPSGWDDLLAVWDLDPALYEVVEPVQYRAWDAPVGAGETKRLFYYRATIRRRSGTGSGVDEVLAAIGRHRPKRPEPSGGGDSFAVLAGDLQIGKIDGDGTQGTVDRFLSKTDAAVRRLRELRKTGRVIDSITLAWLGDCIEGNVSQGGSLAAAGRVDLTVTEQVRIYRRLMLYQVKAFAGLADRIVVPVVPGNHDEAERVGKTVRRYDDSWAIEGAVTVADALNLAGGFEHVSFVFPERDELTITLDVAGTVCGFAHGHQFRTDAVKWWAGQAHGMQPIGDATVLFGAHKHHLKVEQTGAKTFVQIPALDGGSQWWKHQTGQDSPPGLVTLVVGGGGWSDLAVH